MRHPTTRSIKTTALAGAMAAALLIPGLATGAEFEQDVRTYACKRVETPLTIDGKLDEEAWSTAETVSRWIYYPSPDRKATPLPVDRVAAWFLYDDTYLYVGVRVDDPDVVVNPACLEQEKETIWLDGDVVELFLIPESATPAYYEIHVNPHNVVWDQRMEARRYMRFAKLDLRWNSEAETAVTVKGTFNTMDEDEGYVVEMAVPLASLTDRTGEVVRPAPGYTWRAMVALYEYSYQNDDFEFGEALWYISSAKLRRLDFHMRGDYDRIRFE